MECPSCHSLNGENALSCVLCGMVLIRREDPASRQSKNEPLIGASYACGVPENVSLSVHARRAMRFAVFTLLAQGTLGILIYMQGVLADRFVLEGADGAAAHRFVLLGLGVYGWLVLAYALAKTGESVGLGYWFNFTLALAPPTLPAAASRIGGRSILWTYLYLALDALILTAAIRFFDAVPFLMFLIILVEVPLVIYHLAGCATGSIATALGLNSYAVTLWACAAPLALVIYAAIDLGIGRAAVDALVSSNATLNPEGFKALLDPSIVTDNFTLLVCVTIWALVGWIFWFKSVYESLRYPLF